jgi:primosomal protein N' (replication factor Y)
LAFLNHAAGLARAPEEVRVFDPVPHLLTRRAGLERAQLIIQSSSRPALQDFLGLLSEKLFATSARAIRWHIDVDPIEFD